MEIFPLNRGVNFSHFHLNLLKISTKLMAQSILLGKWNSSSKEWTHLLSKGDNNKAVKMD